MSSPRHIFHARQRAAMRWQRLLCIAAPLAMLPTGNVARAAPDLLPGYFLGQAEAVEAQTQIGPLSLQIGNAAAEGCPCQGTNGKRLTDTVTSLSIGTGGAIGVGGVNKSTATALKTATTATTEQTTSIAGVNLLGGLITADGLTADATVNVTTATLTPGSDGTKFANLVVAGQKVKADVKNNTTMQLPGLGSVVVKFVSQATYGNQAAGVEVELLRITISQSNTLGLPVGAILIIGEAYAGYDRTEPKAAIGGYATTLAVTADAGDLLNEAAGAGAISGIPDCLGTDGQTLTSTVANLDAGNLLTVNSATTTAFGGEVGKADEASTSSSVGQISLLGGLITANGVEAVAEESRAHGKSVASSLGTTFDGLYVAGTQIAANVPANTVISLANVGYVALNEQPPVVKDHIQVNGMHIVVTLANNFGLAVGTEIFVAHAEATAQKF